MVNYTLLFDNVSGVLRVNDASNEPIAINVTIYYNGYEVAHFPMEQGGSFNVSVRMFNGKIAKGIYRVVYGSYHDDTVEYSHSKATTVGVYVDGFNSKVRFYDSTGYGSVDEYAVVHHAPNGSVTNHIGNEVEITPVYKGKGWFEYTCRYYETYERYTVLDTVQGRIDYVVYGNDVDELIRQLDGSIDTFKVERQTRLNYYRDRMYDLLSKQDYYGAYRYYSLIYDELNDVPLSGEEVIPYVPSVYNHIHDNKAVLDKLSEVDGDLRYNGQKVNAATATRLQTARSINGTSFDGTSNITTSYWGAARTITIGNTGKSVNGSTNVTWTIAEIGAASATHTHAIADVAGLQSALDGKLNVTEVVSTVSPNKVLRLNGAGELPASVTGNAATATRLQTARSINGTSFDGTSNITTSYWGAARTITIGNTGKSVNGSTNVTWTIAEIGAASATHTHAIADVAGLQSAIDGKVSKSGDTITGDLVINGSAALNRTTIQSSSVLSFNHGTKDIGLRNYDELENRGVTSFYTSKYLKFSQSSTFYNRGFHANLYPLVQENTVSTGYANGFYCEVLRNYKSDYSDNGTLDAIRGHIVNYGHHNSNSSATPITNNAYGIFISPYIMSGTINSMYDIYLGLESGGGTATNKWGIYQSNSKNNLFNGRIGIKTSPQYDLDVSGSARISSISSGVVLSSSGALSGLNGSNGNVLYHNGTGWISKTLNPEDVGALPGAIVSQTVSASIPNGQWYRIAQSIVDVGRCDGVFEIEYGGSVIHERLAFRASSIYNTGESVTIHRLGGSGRYYDGTSMVSIERVRVVYKAGEFSGQRAYVEVFVKNAYPISQTLKVRLYGATGWWLTSGTGTIPSGYTDKTLSVRHANPYYSTNDMRGVVGVSSGLAIVDLRYPNRNAVAININGNTTINISYIYDGAVGNILLNVTATSTITLGTMTNTYGDSVQKHVNGNLVNLLPGFYIISYKCIPDAAGTWRAFFNVSPKYS